MQSKYARLVYNVIQCYTMLYNVIQCYTMLYNVIQCYTVLYSTLSSLQVWVCMSWTQSTLATCWGQTPTLACRRPPMHSSTSSYKHLVGTVKYAATSPCHSQSSTSAAVCGSISEMDNTAGGGLGRGGDEYPPLSSFSHMSCPWCAKLKSLWACS